MQNKRESALNPGENETELVNKFSVDLKNKLVPEFLSFQSSKEQTKIRQTVIFKHSSD